MLAVISMRNTMNTHRLNFSSVKYSRLLKSVLFAMFVVFLSACATVGKDFPVDKVSNIHIGKTTQQELRELLGSPWRTGTEDGQQTWTYGKYNYSLFRAEKAKDLVVKFNDKNVVISYTFSTTDHHE